MHPVMAAVEVLVLVLVLGVAVALGRVVAVEVQAVLGADRIIAN